MLFHKDELRLLWPFYLYYLVFGLSGMIFPFLFVYFKDLGFSFFQLSLMIAAASIGTVIFEVPTGAFADRFSRKYSVIIGFLISGFFIILIPLFKSFLPLFILWFLVGVGFTFISGAEEALVIDNLNHAKRKDLHQEYFVKSQAIALLGMGIAPLAGAIIVKSYPIKFLWVIFGLGFILNALVLRIFAKEYYVPKAVPIKKLISATFKKSREGFRFMRTHRATMLLTLGLVFVTLMLVGEVGWQPLLTDLTLPQYALGLLYSASAAFEIAASFLSRKIAKSNVRKLIVAVTLLRVLVILSLLLVRPPFYIWACVIFVAFFALRAFTEPVIQVYTHKFIPKNIRATVISARSMVKEACYAVVAISFGALMDVFSAQSMIAIAGLFGIFAIAAYLQLK